MQISLNVVFVCIMMVGQLSAALCDFHNDSPHSEEAPGLHWEAMPDGHHHDCINSPADAIALLASGISPRENLLPHSETFTLGFSSLIVQETCGAIAGSPPAGRASSVVPPFVLPAVLRI
jgi:hypothetical protein